MAVLQGKDEHAVFGELHGSDGVVRPVAATGGKTVFFQAPFRVTQAVDEDEQEEAAEGEAVHGVAHADFVVQPGGDDEVEEDGVGDTAAQAHGDLCFAEAVGLDVAVVDKENGKGEVDEAEGDGGEHGGLRKRRGGIL